MTKKKAKQQRKRTINKVFRLLELRQRHIAYSCYKRQRRSERLQSALDGIASFNSRHSVFVLFSAFDLFAPLSTISSDLFCISHSQKQLSRLYCETFECENLSGNESQKRHFSTSLSNHRRRNEKMFSGELEMF